MREPSHITAGARMSDADVYQIKSYHMDDTVTPGWRDWETVPRHKYDEVCSYIEAGYLFYQVRTLTANPAMCHKLSPPDDCPGRQHKGISRNFVGNPFDFRK